MIDIIMKKENVSIVIVTKERHEDLIKCMNSLIIQTKPISELVIIDSSEKCLSDASLKKYRKKFHVNYVHYNCGITEGRNLGIKKSTGDIVIFLDDDVILDKNYVSEIFRVFENYDGRLGAVTGRVAGEWMRTKRFQGLVKSKIFRGFRNTVYRMFLYFSLGNGRFHPSGFPSIVFAQNKIMFIEFMQGSNMAVKREVLKKFKFDENLRGAGPMDDCDFCYRVSRKYKIIYTPYAKLIHNVAKTGGQRTAKIKWRKMFMENSYYLFKKNFPDRIYNKLAFWWSIFGLSLILLVSDFEDFKGLMIGVKSVLLK